MRNDSLAAFQVSKGDKLSAERHNGFIRRVRDMSLERAPGRRPGVSGSDSVTVVKISSDAAGGGKYNGRIMTGGISIGASGDLTLPEQLVDPGADNTLIANLAEDGQPTHWLKAGSYALGSIAGLSIVEIFEGIARTASPDVLGDGTEGTETAGTDTWNRASAGSGTNYGDNPIDVWVISRVVYNPTGDMKLYAMTRKLSFAADGKLSTVSAETRVEVSDTCVEEAIDGGTF